jgi:hypothetical protein
MSKVIVLSEKGKLVGTWVPPRKPEERASPATGGARRRGALAAKKEPSSSIITGKGQKLHMLEVEDAESAQQTGELVKLVKKQLKLK